MNIVMDGTIYSYQVFGGITQILSEILPRLCNLDSSLSIDLWTWPWLKQPLPHHAQIRHCSFSAISFPRLYPRRFWKGIEHGVERYNARKRETVIVSQATSIWHSTYYWLPKSWKRTSIVTVYDMKEELFPKIANDPSKQVFRNQKEDCIRRSDCVICISEATRQDVLEYYGIKKEITKAIPLAYNPIYRPLDHEPISQQFLLYVGRRDRFKNFDTVARAYSQWKYRSSISLVVVGGTEWTTSERKLITDLGISENICLLRQTDNETLCELYNQATAFVYPSLYEGFGIPLLEAMACGCPVIASRIPSSLEIAGAHAIYFKPQDIDSLLAAFDLALSEGRTSERVHNGLEWVKRYSWDKSAREILSAYQSLL